MSHSGLQESSLDPNSAAVDFTLQAGDPWLHKISAGQTFRIVDLCGNQAVDTFFYNADDLSERYSATDTILGQKNIYLTTKSVLRSNLATPMLTIVADTCGRHDTLGGACSTESNTVRYALEKRYMHACRQSFLRAVIYSNLGLTKRDIGSNINFFMNVPVTPEGKLTFADGISEAGKYVEMRAEMDVLALISNCPQLNNPCNAYNPTPVRLLVWETGS
jgi:urea carboxylase-associated protein 1